MAFIAEGELVEGQIQLSDGPLLATAVAHERGAGETQASGSSSCAVAAAGVRTGRLAPGRISVVMPGGELVVVVLRFVARAID